MRKRICTLLALGIVATTALSVSAFSFKFYKGSPKRMAEPVVIEQPSAAKVEPFEILPTMDSTSNAKNQVWVGTFQLIWNDLVNELIKQPVEFMNYESVIADKLNKKEFTTDNISESAYYKVLGLASNELKAEIIKGIKDKFDETSDIIEQFDFTPAEDKYILYAMLKKDFQYIHSFNKLPEAEFKGSEGLVKYFGTDKNSDMAMRANISVLFYNNDDDYALALRSNGDDVIFLYRTNDDATLDVLYSDMMKKSGEYTGDRLFTAEDKFKAPMIEFKKERSFDELCDKQIKDTNLYIAKAVESVQFNMSESGVKLKSEAGMAIMKTSLMPPRSKTPRYFYFNDKYVIFLAEAGKKPYFALKVTDAKALQ